MDIAFLGTGSAYPSPHRGASCIAIRYEGDAWLIDCGEGSQTQLMRLKTVRPGNISKIFITHLHGDHVFGLPGLLCTISMAFKSQDDSDFKDVDGCDVAADSKVIEIYGPIGLRRFIREALNLSRSVLSYKYVVHELIPEKQQYTHYRAGDPDWSVWNPEQMAKGPLHFSELGTGRAIYMDGVLQAWPVFKDEVVTVCAGQLKHRIPSFGFVFEESSKPGRLDSAKLARLGVPKGPLYGRIKNGESITLDDGRVLNPHDFIGPPQPGRKIAILQDTRDSWAMKDLCHRCNVLVHEATLENANAVRCVENGHSTPQMAARFAHSTESEMLVMTHFSQRYKSKAVHEVKECDRTTDILVEEARSVFPGPVIAAHDGLLLNVKRKTAE